MQNTALNFEIQRKVFHLCSLIFPLVYIFSSKIAMGTFLMIISGLTLYLDISRHYKPKIKEVVDKIFGKILRPREKSGDFIVSGATYMAFGFLITCLLFSKGLAITSWLILIISDCFAAIMGMKYGSPLFNGKSFAGSVTFFLSSIFISMISYFAIGYKTSFLIIIFSCLLCTMIEFFSEEIKINDNLTIPLTYSLSTFILSLI